MEAVSRIVEERLAEVLARYDAPSAAMSALSKLLECLTQPQAPTAVHDAERGVDIHIADSLVGLEVPEMHGAQLIADLGAGAGHLGLRVEPIRSVDPYPESERRTLHVLRKVASTPPNFPRRAGIATKR